MKLSTFAIAFTLSVAAAQSFAKDVRLQPVNNNVETQACLTAAKEGFGPALRFIRNSGYNVEEFNASLRCNGESLRTFAYMYKNNKETNAAKTIALVARNKDVASQACLEALTIGKDAALVKYGLEGENIICNHKNINDFVRKYSVENVVVRANVEAE